MGKYDIGKRFVNRYGTEYEIIYYVNPNRRIIKFSDYYGFEREVDINRNKWQSRGTDLYTGKAIHYGRYSTKEEAIEKYKEGKDIQNEVARDFLRNLGYLDEAIINLIK